MVQSRYFFKLSHDLDETQILYQLSHAALKVFLALARLADGATGQAYPSHTYLAAKTLQTERSVRRAVSQLRRAGLVRILAPSIRGVASAVYQVNNARRPTVGEGHVPREVQLSFGFHADPPVQQSHPQADPGVLYTKSQSLTKTTRPAQGGPTPEAHALAVLLTKQAKGMSLLAAQRLIGQWGVDRVRDKLRLMRQTKDVKRPAAWLTTAVQEDYQPGLKQRPPAKPPSAGLRKNTDAAVPPPGAPCTPKVDLAHDLAPSQERHGAAIASSRDQFQTKYAKFFRSGT